MDLVKGKVAVLTGAARGIGRSAAEALAKNGAKGIAIADLDIDTAIKTAAEIADQYGTECIAVKCNVTDEGDVKSVFEAVMDKFGTVDILVNSAGISRILDMNELTMQQWDLTMNINVKGTFLFCREALKIMKKNRSGKIVNLASQAGRIGGLIVSPDYPASKAAVICLTKSLAKNAAASNVNVNSVAPGLIATEMTQTYNYDPETIPLKRVGTAEEIADVILFLASDLSRYITGGCIDVNGGMTMI